MDLYLPGRASEPEDYEAKDALCRLLASEHLQMTADDDLLSRISDCIKHNISMLERVSSLVESLKSGDDEEGEDRGSFTAGPERTDTRSIDDFLKRINRVRREDHAKSEQALPRSRSYG